jgi:hypothetical protein
MVKYSKRNLLKFSIILKKIKVNRKTIGLIEQDQLAMLRVDLGHFEISANGLLLEVVVTDTQNVYQMEFGCFLWLM